MNNPDLQLPEKPTIRDFQRYVEQLVIARGFAGQPIPEVFMLFLEECGELAKAARKQLAMGVDKNSASYQVGHEAADVLIFLLVLCNRFGIDLETAFREKEEINKKRTWG